MPASATSLSGKRILLGVSGSIAAFKAVALASDLTNQGALVDVLLTPSALQFVTPLSFSSITHRSVTADVFAPSARAVSHVALGVEADVMVVAPATADCIAGLALGLADDPVRLIALSCRAPIILAPAMETLMYEHPAVQTNLAMLRQRGCIVVEPNSGRLASGRFGRGRLAEVPEIVAALRQSLGQRQDLTGRTIVVTAGGTREPIDPVRYIGNHSSGKMGFAVAEAARDRGATVRLIACSTSVAPPIQVALQQVTTAAELEAAVHAAVVGADAIVMAAAVADYRVASVSDHKLKRTGEDVLLRLVPNSDIIASLKEERLIKIGFAAETEDVVTNAGVKLMRKGLDLIVANDLTSPGSGFGTDTNAVFLIDSSGVEALPLLSKTEVGHRVLDRLVRLFERPKSATE